MPHRFGVALLVFVVAPLGASAQTTTTTMPYADCGANAPTEHRPFTNLNCRIEVLREKLFDAHLAYDGVAFRAEFRLQKSQRYLQRARWRCDGTVDTNANRARRRLRRSVELVGAAAALIRSKEGQRTLPEEVGAALAAEAEGIAGDMEEVGAALTCP